MIGAETVIHLAGSERYGFHPKMIENDVIGTEVLAEAAAEAGVKLCLSIAESKSSFRRNYHPIEPAIYHLALWFGIWGR
jgi:nucleoside-diphosphate-sugar epimerase